jgi:hypothetical protein
MRDTAIAPVGVFLKLDFSNWRHGLKVFGRREKHKISCWQTHDQHTRQGRAKESAQSLKSAKAEGHVGFERGKSAYPGKPLNPEP